MNTEFSLRQTELAPDWLSLTPHDQRVVLLELLRHAPLSKGQMVHAMLAAPPWPTDADDAEERVAAVIRYLTSGYRVGDPHPTTEEAQHE